MRFWGRACRPNGARATCGPAALAAHCVCMRHACAYVSHTCVCVLPTSVCVRHTCVCVRLYVESRRRRRLWPSPLATDPVARRQPPGSRRQQQCAQCVVPPHKSSSMRLPKSDSSSDPPLPPCSSSSSDTFSEESSSPSASASFSSAPSSDGASGAKASSAVGSSKSSSYSTCARGRTARLGRAVTDHTHLSVYTITQLNHTHRRPVSTAVQCYQQQPFHRPSKPHLWPRSQRLSCAAHGVACVVQHQSQPPVQAQQWVVQPHTGIDRLHRHEPAVSAIACCTAPRTSLGAITRRRTGGHAPRGSA